MLEFANPFVLLLAPALLWLGLRWRRREAPALVYPDTGLLAEAPPGRARRAERWGTGLRVAALALLLAAWAGPRWAGVATRLPTEGIAGHTLGQ